MDLSRCRRLIHDISRVIYNCEEPQYDITKQIYLYSIESFFFLCFDLIFIKF